MRIEQIMSTAVRSCRAAQNASDAAQILWEHDCGCVPGVDDGGRVAEHISSPER